MKKVMKFIQGTKQEHGIALLFALVMLALLLVMALSFATNSMFSQKISTNNANGSSARLLAQSTAHRIVGMMNNYYQNKDFNLENYYSYIAGTTSEDMMDLFTPKADGYDDAFKWDATNDGSIDWEYIYSNGEIIGRVAYIAVVNGVNPAACVKDTENEGLWPEVRVGAEVNEINLQSLGITAPVATQLSYTATGQLTSDGNWLDFSNMFDKVTLTATQKEACVKWFMIDPPEDDELFWIDGVAVLADDADGVVDDTEKLNRFNLNRFTDDDDSGGDYDSANDTNLWDSMTVATILSVAKVSGDANPNDGGIPWLFYFGKKWTTASTNFVDDSSLKANFTAVADRRNQIAANLIDYCDSDSVPTSDQADWTTNTPTYTGNEKTAYINELVIDVFYTVSAANVGGGPPPNRSHDCTVNVSISAEIIDIYGTTGSYTLTIYGKQWIDASNINGTVIPAANLDEDFSSTPLSKAINDAATGIGYTTVDPHSDILSYSSSALGDTVTNNSAQSNVDFGIVHIRIDKVILSIGTNNIDIANFGSAGYDVQFPARNNVTAGVGTADQYYISQTLSVKDPRQNLNAGGLDLDWKNDIAQGSDNALPSTARTAANATLGATNYQCDPLYAYDPVGDGSNTGEAVADAEISNDQSVVSTAYIRNAPMLSPWELGFIHRGNPYQTINLKKFDTDFAVTYKNNGVGTDGKVIGTYTDGDGNILDQIKMNDNIKNPMKIDLKSPRINVLTSLLNKIQLGSAVATPGASSTDVINVSTTTASIYNNRDALLTRAQVIDAVANLSDGTMGTQTTDATQEEVIGKFINLTKLGGVYTIVVAAQSINDVGGVGVDINISKKDSGGVTQSVDCRKGVWDYDSANDIYFDEITGEQKMVVRVRQDPLTGKMTIIDLQYLY